MVPAGPRDAQLLDAGEVLAEVIDLNARFGLGDRLRRQRALHADGLEILRLDLDGRGSIVRLLFQPLAKPGVLQPGCVRRASWVSPS